MSASESFYDASVIKRKRRTDADLVELLSAVKGVLGYYGKEQITIRHLFYRLASTQVITKEEKSYQSLNKHLTNWRKEGLIPFNRFVDSSRWHYGSGTFDSAAEALEDSITGYRKNLWRDQPYYVEIWCEKEAIASIVTPVASRWGLRTYPCRGFNSWSSAAAAAETFKEEIENGKKPAVFYLGDYDKSGLEIDQNIVKQFRHFDIDDDILFERIAILPEHIRYYDLPTRPPKKDWHGGECVEIDTLSSSQIRTLLEKKITSLVDGEQWRRLQAIEKAEQDTLSKILHLHRRELQEVA